MFAVVGFEVCFLVATGTASILAFALGLVNHSGRHNTSGYSDDGVTEYHDETGEEASHNSDGGDVTITDCGEGDNCPVDAGADVGELGAWLSSLDNEHEGAEDGDKNKHEEEIDEYLAETQTNALEKQITFVDEGEKFEYTEDTKESEDSQNEEVTCGGKVRNKGEIEGQSCHKIYDSEETEGVVLGTWRTVESEDVLDGEEEGEDILHDGEHILETPHDCRLGLNECDNEAKDDGNHDGDVKCLACLGVGIEHDIIEAFFVFK